MKKLLIAPALIALIATGCGQDGPTGFGWKKEIRDEMEQYLGTVLPYVNFNQETLESMWIESESTYYVWDFSEVDVIAGYGDKLLAVGWSTVEIQGIVNYTKVTSAGTLTLNAKYSIATQSNDASNEIAVYVDGGGDVPPGDDPVTGTYTFTMSKMGWADQTDNPSIVADPGLTIGTDAGENTNPSGVPKYFNNGASIRLYALNTLTLAADEITKIDFTFSNVKDNQTMTASVGSISSFTKTSATWEGSASQVTFTLGTKGQIHISEMVVTGTFSGGGVAPGGEDEEVLETANAIAALLGDKLDGDIEYESGEAILYGYFEEADSLLSAVTEGINYLPTTFEEYLGPEADTWDDGSDGYFAIYTHVDYEQNGLIAQLGSFLEDGTYYVQYYIYIY